MAVWVYGSALTSRRVRQSIRRHACVARAEMGYTGIAMGAWCVCVASSSLTWFAAFGTTGVATRPDRCCVGVLHI